MYNVRLYFYSIIAHKKNGVNRFKPFSHKKKTEIISFSYFPSCILFIEKIRRPFLRFP